MPERVSGPPPGCCQAQHFRASRLVSAGRGRSLAARFCWQGQHFRLWTVPERVSGPPPLDAARRSTFEPRGSFLLAGAALQALDGARARFGAPPLDAARRSTLEPRGSFLLAGAALQALDGARARFGAFSMDAARRSTLEPRGSFLLAGAALQALDGARARFGAPPSMLQHFRASRRLVSAGRGSTLGSGPCPSAFRGPLPSMLPGAALWSLAARFCWQGQHFRLWTVPERVSGPPRLDAARRSTFEPRGSFLLAGAALQALDGARARFGAPLLDAARRSTFEPRGSFLLAGAALQALDGARARFGAPPFDAARRSTFEPRGSFLLAGAALQALDGARACSGPPPSMLPGAALWSLAARFCWQGQHFSPPP